MIERLLISLSLLVVGFVIYHLYRRQHLQRAAVQAAADPILQGLVTGVPAVVYFTTPSCIPCQTQQQPALQRLKTELGERVQIVQIDATQDAAAAARWGVQSAPTTFILDGSGLPRNVNYGVADAVKLKRQLDAVGYDERPLR